MISGIDAPTLKEQIRLLEAYPKIANEEFTVSMKQAMVVLKVDIAGRAPIGTGRMATSTSSEIRYAVGDNIRAVITNDARAADGFPYPYALDASAKFRRRRGRGKTKGWFRGSLSRKRRDVQQLMTDARNRTVARLTVDRGY